MPTLLADSFTVAPDAGLVIWMIVVPALGCACICACVVTAMKGLWPWLVAGLATSGLACLYSAFLPAAPRSWWARRRASA